MDRRGASEGKRYQNTYYTNKPLLQTIYKDKTNKSTIDQRWQKLNPDFKVKQGISMQIPNSSAFLKETSFQGHANNQEKESIDMHSTQGKLFGANFNHHNPDMCVCSECLCGRHMCKLHAIAPDMSKASVYQQSFRKRSQVPIVILKASDAFKNQGPHLDINSVQRNDFSGRRGDDTARPHPEDQLKTGGPAQNLTTYSSGFPGFKGENQYIKPTDNMVRGNFPLMNQTTYGKSFIQSKGRAASLEKTPDSFRHGAPWLGNSTYGNNFRAPNPENYINTIKTIEKWHPEPKYTHQYETVYKNDFLQTESTVCGSKKLLEGKIKGKMSNMKGKFAENMDFKALSPDYHALSTSKQSFA